MPDIVDASGSMFASTGPTPFEEIERRIRRAKTTPEGIEQNLLVARAAHSAMKSEKIVGQQHSFHGSTWSMGEIKLWSDLYLIYDGRPWIPFFDTRRKNRLSDLGRRFAFSMQHERIRLLEPDFADAGLMVVQFGNDEESRIARFVMHDGGPLYSYSELLQMIEETYEIWREVCEERAAETRRRAGGSLGGLL